MRKVAVIGGGHTRFTANSPNTSLELAAEASMDAVLQAGLTPKDIQAICCGNVLGEFSDGQGMIHSYLANDLGCSHVPAFRYEGACATGTMAVRDAAMWIASGVHDIILVCGVEKATAMGTPLATRTFAMFGDSRFEYPAGFTFPAVFAMLAHLYAAHYDIPLKKLKQQMAQVSVQSHFYGVNNPNAQFQKEITVEKVLGGPMVTTPLQLLDCCPFTDGAAAVVLASEDVARKICDKPVFIAGTGQASSGHLASQYRHLPHIRAREISVKQAYDMAGIGPKDVDICELHDCFSIASIIAAESLGFAEAGTAGKMWEEGEFKINGRTPINISGGLKSKGHPIGATGVSQVYEVTKQLRYELAEQGRQVEGAKVGLVDTLGGDGIIVNLVLKRE